MDRKAVYLGSLCQAVVFAVVFPLFSLLPSTASFVAGGLVAGWNSDSYENEFVDGAASAVLGVLLSLLVLICYNWIVLPTNVLRYKIDYALLTALQVGGLVVVSIPIAGVVGCFTGHVAARLRDAYGRPAP
ncbi:MULTISPECIES: hypothetical protein [Halorussus]|uniref:DUF5518 domain-containing protein n=1 Tax=Halorussus TaxID=1070314 RepID=UPI000E20F246|nr:MULTISPECIES: hypothetical protein [Halorussus]NHN60765.1 hypothetical protein [Halorussus sp. JP-T4]